MTAPPDPNRSLPETTAYTRDPGANTLIQRLVTAWNAGTPVPLDELLPPDPSASLVADVSCQELELRLRANEPARAADYLERVARAAGCAVADLPESLVLYLVEAEILGRKKYGPPPSVEEYLGQFPHLRSQIERLVRTAPPPAAPPESPPGYELAEKIGHGGMGDVYRARDVALKRDVAVKVLQARFPPTSDMARRFLEEAQITGQLQHPGIPAVHQVGTLPGGRPFLAMKLIKGETLATLIKEKAELNTLGVFEAICQAVAYAHERGVIHRDLKPENVMVGTFGEVQVMDWGLAKLLGRAEPPAATSVEVTTTIEDPRTPERRDSTGAAGTPWYMSPEQAAGEQDRIDWRTDVFALGGVLCAMLTGQPPIEGDGPKALVANAIRGDTAAAFARLDACGAEPEWVALCKRCLAFQPEARPADASELARVAGGLRKETAERARRAEVERVAAEARAEEEVKTRREAEARAGAEERARLAAQAETREQRKRRRTQLALAGLLAVLLVSVGGFVWWQDQQSAQREHEAGVARDSARSSLDLAEGNLRQVATDWRRLAVAKAQLDAANQQLGTVDAPELRARLASLKRAVATVEKLDAILERRWIHRLEGGTADYRSAQKAYTELFRELNFPLDRPEEFARLATESVIRDRLVEALTDWLGLIEVVDRNAPPADIQGARVTYHRVVDVLNKLDPDPDRENMRNAILSRGEKAEEAVREFAKSVKPESHAPSFLYLVGTTSLLKDEEAIPLLRKAWEQYRDSMAITYRLAARLRCTDVDRAPEGIGFYRVALAIRPNHSMVHGNMGYSFWIQGKFDEAETSLRKAMKLDPSNEEAHLDLANTLLSRDWDDERRARAGLGAYTSDGRESRLCEASRELEEAARFSPRWSRPHYGLAELHRRQGNLPRAREEAMVALGLAANEIREPNSELREAFHYETWEAYHVLARIAEAEGRPEAALDHYRMAFRVSPNRPDTGYHLAHALRTHGQLAEALCYMRWAADRAARRPYWPHDTLGEIRELEQQLGKR